jgi:UDP-N-acetylmuramoyl-L-alanyl-D-glutamate--2,6-diaminopimelate ligase
MQLTNLISSLNVLKFEGNKTQSITGIAFHSKQIKPGYLFVCIRGLKTDGHLFINEAINQGAVAIVVEKWQQVPPGVSQILVSGSRSALAKMSSVFFGNPTSKLKLIGVTGTNGKTTTAQFIENIFSAAGLKTGLLGTIEYKIGDEKLPVGRTTPESYDLQNIFRQMVEKEVKVAVIEVSSHAVDLHRTDECEFDALVFTNLSQDHLDYHGTLDKYFEVKNRLFLNHAGSECIFVINLDDAYGQRIASISNPKKVYYGLQESAQVKALDIILESSGSHFRISSSASLQEIDLQLLGFFNVYNALAAAALGLAFDLPLKVIKKGLEAVENVSGRFEVVDCGQNFSVIVDYAHTPDGLEKLLSSARDITKGRLITIFGCGGDRDKLKRPLMGEVAGNLSDNSIITSDNPRSEDPNVIISQIEEGLKKVTSNYCLEVDRKKAIYKGISMADENDCVIIAGKGHETYQEFKDKTVPFDDRIMAKEALRKLAICSP